MRKGESPVPELQMPSCRDPSQWVSTFVSVEWLQHDVCSPKPEIGVESKIKPHEGLAAGHAVSSQESSCLRDSPIKHITNTIFSLTLPFDFYPHHTVSTMAFSMTTPVLSARAAGLPRLSPAPRARTFAPRRFTVVKAKLDPVDQVSEDVQEVCTLLMSRAVPAEVLSLQRRSAPGW